MQSTDIAPIFVFRNNNVAIHSVCFDLKNNPNLFSGSLDGSISIYDTKSFRKISQHEQCHSNSINKLMFSENDQLISQGRDGYVKFWSAENGKLEESSSIQTKCTSFCKFDISMNNQYLACAIEDPNIFNVWDLKSKTPIFTSTDLKHGMYMCLNFTYGLDQTYLTSLSDDGSLIVWDIANNKMILEKKVHKDSGLAMSITQPKLNINDEQISYIITGGADGDIHFMTMNWTKMTIAEDSIRSLANGVQDIVVRNDQKLIAVGGWDHRVRIFSTKKLKPLAILKYHSKSIQSLAFCKKTNFLAASSSDGKISLWDIYN